MVVGRGGGEGGRGGQFHIVLLSSDKGTHDWMSEFSGTVAKDFVDLPENETNHLDMADDDNKDSNTKRMEKDFPITER